MIKDYQSGFYYVGAWYDSSWYKTLCDKMVVDCFGNLVKI